MAVKKGDKIKVEYTGTLDDGTVFDSSEKHGQPLEFEVGSGQIIKGFDEAVIGMEKGQSKEVKIPPTKAYGSRMDKLVQTVPKDMVPSDVTPKPGSTLTLQAPTGQIIPAKVIDVKDDELTLDLNHPLADKTLNFKIEIVAC